MKRRKAIKLALAALAGAVVPAGVAFGEMATLGGVAGLGRPYVADALGLDVRVRIMHPDVHGGRWFDVPGIIGGTGSVDLKLPADERTYQMRMEFRAAWKESAS